MEDGVVTVARAKRTITYPAQFMCVASLNPCPCGYFGADARRCRCTPMQIERYMSKVSGPLMDRMDIHIEVPALAFSKLRAKRSAEESGSAAIRECVLKARQLQQTRFAGAAASRNAVMTHRQVERFCTLDKQGEMFLKSAMVQFGLSARAHDKICKVARSIADLEGARHIASEHVAEAISYRRLDRRF
jgi:magnesium chelatase family protein